MHDHNSQNGESSPFSPNVENDSTEVTVLQPAQRLWLTVEPALFCVTIGSALCSSVYTQLLLERSCEMVFGLSHENCTLLVNKTGSKEAHELEELVQPHVTMLQMYKSIIEACVPTVLCLFVGAWSDVHGRKPLIMWPLFGYGVYHGVVAILSMIPDLSPTYLLLASLPIAFSGGLMTIINGVYAYISDVSSPEKRAFRMGMLDASIFGGFLIGTISSAPLFSVMGKYGYITVFATSSVLGLIGFLYVVFLPESVNTNQTEESNGGIGSVFDYHLVVKMISTCCKRREHFKRIIIFLMILAISTCVITMEGESAVVFLYTRRKFGWDLTKFTRFSSFGILLLVLGNISGMYIFSMWLKVSDSKFAFAIFITKFASTLMFAFAPNEWYLYSSCVIGVFGAVIGPLCRSILSKCVPQKDVGAVFALTSVVEALTPLAASPLYNLVYSATLLTFPGAFLLLSSSLYMLDIIIVSVVIVLQRISAPPGYSQMQIQE